MKNVIFLLFLFSSGVKAYTCRDYNNGQTSTGGNYTISIPLDRQINSGSTVFFDLSRYFKCRNDSPDRYTDYMDLYGDGITTVLDSDVFKTSAIVNGRVFERLPIPNASSVNIFTLRDGAFHDVPISINYQVSSLPGKIVKIKSGDIIGTIKMRFHSVPVESDHQYNWIIKAANDAVLTSGTCKINNGDNIDVNFGSVTKAQLTSSGSSSSSRRRVEVPYQCENPVSMPVSITLSAASAVFSKDSIALSNSNLAVQMFYDGSMVRPGESIKTQLQQGMGQNTFDFVLIKKDGADVTVGKFTGSAVLVMSVD